MNYFKENEYTCKCGCGLSKLHPTTLLLANITRNFYDRPMKVNSGCRCNDHNQKVKGAKNSSHTPRPDGWCYAMDISCTNSSDRFFLIEAMRKAGINRIGIHESFVHFDNDPHKTVKVVFLY